jgi:hypothetical protein
LTTLRYQVSSSSIARIDWTMAPSVVTQIARKIPVPIPRMCAPGATAAAAATSAPFTTRAANPKVTVCNATV